MRIVKQDNEFRINKYVLSYKMQIREKLFKSQETNYYSFSFKELKKFHFAMIVSFSILEMKMEMNAEADRSILGGSVNCEMK